MRTDRRPRDAAQRASRRSPNLAAARPQRVYKTGGTVNRVTTDPQLTRQPHVCVVRFHVVSKE